MYNNGDSGDENMGGDEEFHLRPEWEQAALEKDSQKMANVLYYDLKQQKHSGIIPHPDSIYRMIESVDDILYREYHWNDDQLKKFREEFSELNKYYPTSQPENTIEITLPYSAMMDNRINRDHILPLHISPRNNKCPQQNSGTVEIISKKEEKKIWTITKDVIQVVFKIVVYWLAINGLVTLLGV